jgi:hypothetical protein
MATQWLQEVLQLAERQLQELRERTTQELHGAINPYAIIELVDVNTQGITLEEPEELDPDRLREDALDMQAALYDRWTTIEEANAAVLRYVGRVWPKEAERKYVESFLQAFVQEQKPPHTSLRQGICKQVAQLQQCTFKPCSSYIVYSLEEFLAPYLSEAAMQATPVTHIAAKSLTGLIKIETSILPSNSIEYAVVFLLELLSRVATDTITFLGLQPAKSMVG